MFIKSYKNSFYTHIVPDSQKFKNMAYEASLSLYFSS